MRQAQQKLTIVHPLLHPLKPHLQTSMPTSFSTLILSLVPNKQTQDHISAVHKATFIVCKMFAFQHGKYRGVLGSMVFRRYLVRV